MGDRVDKTFFGHVPKVVKMVQKIRRKYGMLDLRDEANQSEVASGSGSMTWFNGLTGGSKGCGC